MPQTYLAIFYAITLQFVYRENTRLTPKKYNEAAILLAASLFLRILLWLGSVQEIPKVRIEIFKSSSAALVIGAGNVPGSQVSGYHIIGV